MRRSLEISQDIIDLGSEMFASADLKVISYKGENYYRACGAELFQDPDNGTTSSCIKPIGHVYSEHEDANGCILDRVFKVSNVEPRIRSDAFRILRQTGIEESEIFNVLNALQYAGFELVRES